jgi:hypothetical protein
VRPAPNDPTFPYLFYKNKDVAMHNKYMLSLMPDNEIMINAIDLEEENHDNVPYHQHTTTFPSQLILKFDMLVEIYACNYDSQDGLVNGVDGIIKAYTKTDNIDVLWIKFHDSLIGHRQANKLAYLYNSDTPHNWTPVLVHRKTNINDNKDRSGKDPKTISNSTCMCTYNTQVTRFDT